MALDEGRRQAYLAALGIPLWTARQPLPGALPAQGLEAVTFVADEGDVPAEALLPEVGQGAPAPVHHQVREPAAVHVASHLPQQHPHNPFTSRPEPTQAPVVEKPAPAVERRPDTERPAATSIAARAAALEARAMAARTGAAAPVEFPVFQFLFKTLPEGWQLLIQLGDMPDLSRREFVLLSEIEQALGGEGQQVAPPFKWPLNNNPAIARDAQAAREALYGFFGRYRRPGSRCLVLGFDVAPYVPPEPDLVIVHSLAELLAEPLRKRMLWNSVHGAAE